MMRFAHHSEPMWNMEGAEGGGAPAAEAPAVTPTTPDITGTPESGLDSSPPQEEFDVIKYNHEEVKIPKSERQTYLQKGYNYDKVKTELDTAKQQAAYLEKVAKLYNYPDVQTYLKAVDEYEQQQTIKAEAARLNVPEEVIINHLQPMKQQLQQYESQLQQIQTKEWERATISDIERIRSQNPDFDKYTDKVIDLIVNRGMSAADAYEFASYKDKLSAVAQRTEAETIRKLQANAQGSPGALGQEGADHKTGFAALSKEQQRAMIEEVKRGDRRSF